MTAIEKKIIERSSQVFFSGTILSRITGLVRDVTTAYVFGSSASIAALMVAFRFSSLLRRILGEGAMHAAFVPAYEKIRLKSDQNAACFFVDLSILLSLVLLLLIVIGELGLCGALSFGTFNRANTQIVTLTMVLLPSLFFICNSAFCSSLLQCHNIFFLPAVSPSVFNLFWIMGVLVLKSQPIDLGVTNLSYWILMGLFVQLVVLVPNVLQCLKMAVKSSLKINYTRLKASLKVVATPLGLGIIGVSTTQINSALDSLFARAMSLEGPAYLWYAIRIQQVPLALFGVAMAGAILPPLARSFNQGREEFLSLLNYSLSRAVGLLMPCLAALFVTGNSCVNLLYSRGEFGVLSAHHTSLCLWAYTFGLLPQGLVLILGPAFYVQNRYFRTTRASIITLMINVVLNILFAFVLRLPPWSVALATSISSWFQAGYLFHYLIKGFSLKKLKQFFFSSQQVIILCLVVAYLTYVITIRWRLSENTFIYYEREFSKQIQSFVWQTSVFLALLFGLASVFRVREIKALLGYLPLISRKK